jgi:ribA/ribD-fused uncharacterized protein
MAISSAMIKKISDLFDVCCVYPTSGDSGFGCFYAPGSKISPFGNFWDCIVTDETDYVCGSSEHAYQRSKFLGSNKAVFDSVYKTYITQGHCSGEAAWRAANDLKHLVRSDWKQVNYKIMRDILVKKFKKGTYERIALDATGDMCLIEFTRKVPGYRYKVHEDKYWGDSDGTGRNELGKMLMSERSEGKITPTPQSYKLWVKLIIAQTASAASTPTTKAITTETKTKLMCKTCGKAPAFFDTKSGIQHDYCKISHAPKRSSTVTTTTTATTMTTTTTTTPTTLMCVVCNVNRAYLETKPIRRQHLCCTKSCAAKLCIGCKKVPKCKNPAGGFFDFCNRTCAKLHGAI